MSAPCPLLLFSGLAADQSVFAHQLTDIPGLVVPSWQKPHADEDLDAYCCRWADELRPLQPRFLGGASFGGIVALEVAQRLQPDAVFLIGSVRSPAEIPRRIRHLRVFRSLLPAVPLRALQWSARVTARLPHHRALRHLLGIARLFGAADPDVVRWSARQILEWRQTPVLKCPVYAIHGDADPIFPLRGCHPDAIVRGGGHVISLTHPEQVTAFLLAGMAGKLPKG